MRLLFDKDNGIEGVRILFIISDLLQELRVNLFDWLSFSARQTAGSNNGLCHFFCIFALEMQNNGFKNLF